MQFRSCGKKRTFEITNFKLDVQILSIYSKSECYWKNNIDLYKNNSVDTFETKAKSCWKQVNQTKLIGISSKVVGFITVFLCVHII